jgi:small-conductance mechanosensitive channel
LFVVVAVLAVVSYVLYETQQVSGIVLPYSETTLTLLWAALGLLVVWMVGRVTERVAATRVGVSSASTFRKLLTTLLLLGILFAVMARLGLDPTNYLLSLGITAVVIGFAAQQTLSNLVAGAMVMISKPFKQGDYVKVNIAFLPIEGRIVEVAFLRCRILTNDGVTISVPNTLLVSVPVSNYTVLEKRPLIIDVTIDRNSNLETFTREVEDAVKRNQDIGELTNTYINALKEDTIVLELWISVTTQNYLSERSKIIQTIRDACTKTHIDLKSVTVRD